VGFLAGPDSQACLLSGMMDLVRKPSGGSTSAKHSQMYFIVCSDILNKYMSSICVLVFLSGIGGV